MKHRFIMTLGILLLAASAAAQEYRGVSLEMLVSNGNGREQVVVLGVREGATTGIDPTLEESELPPLPPNEIFDVRCISTPGKSQLGLGSLADFRPYPSAPMAETFTIGYQAGINASSVTVSWAESLPGRVTKLLVDGEDVSGETSVETQFATGQIIVEVTFDPQPLRYSISPNPLTFMVTSRGTLPTKTLTVKPEGDPKAGWILSTDVDWLTINPMSGEGEQMVDVSVNTQTMPAGEYTGMIRVRSAVYDVEADVDVRMDMIVGVEQPAAAHSMRLMANYPNPFNPGTVIRLDLGAVSAASHPKLTVHDMLGREVADLTSQLRMHGGEQRVHFDASSLPAGSYNCVLRCDGNVSVRSMSLIK